MKKYDSSIYLVAYGLLIFFIVLFSWQRLNSSDGEVLMKAKVVGLVQDRWTNHCLEIKTKNNTTYRVLVSQEDFESLNLIPSEKKPVIADVTIKKYLIRWLGVQGKITKVY